MICWLTLALLILTPAVRAQQNDAETLYRAVEKKLASQKEGYKLSFDLEFFDENVSAKQNGELIVGGGNKMRLTIATRSLSGKVQTQLTQTLISNGTQMNFREDNNGISDSTTGTAPEKLTGNITGHLTTTSLFIGFGQVIAALPPIAPNTMKLKDFKIAGKERVGAVEGVIIEYKVVVPDTDEEAICKLWLDPIAFLPVKRTMEFNAKNGRICRVVESYGDWQFSPKLKGDEFTLPK